ncbi:GNAT family N-acetyltransferase [Alkalicoccus chagannorensis]|uniref:GNAT family N-acetyltransferase n=1 Tax=Alkalicoccus chagannorensis TaxID=427072 RepID=UPI0003FC5926|nr:N-acetyltransferase [Alkalicoccus chagannorensis]
MHIREEKTADYLQVEQVVQQAFSETTTSSGEEHLLVARLRRSDAYLPSLSLVAEVDGKVAAHLLMTRIGIEGVNRALALAPVSTAPAFQKQGFGTALVQEALKRAKEEGYEAVTVLGEPSFYERFGFRAVLAEGIRPPFDTEAGHYLALELQPGVLEGVSSKVEYSEAFQTENGAALHGNGVS